MSNKSGPRHIPGTHQTWANSWVESSVKTPNFWRRKARKQDLPINGYSWDQTIGGCSKGFRSGSHYFWDLDDLLDSLYAWSTGSPLVTWVEPPDQTKTLTRLQRRVLSDIRSQLTGAAFNAPVALGELKGTASTIVSVCQTIATSFRELKKGQPLNAVKTLLYGPDVKDMYGKTVSKALSDRWLEWSYGVKPLMSDVAASFNAIDEAWRADLQTRYRAAAEDILNKEAHNYVIGKPPNSVYEDRKMRAALRCVAKITTICGNPASRSASSLGLTNPLTVAWELIPLSFVVDWFLPVGDWLQGIAPVVGQTFKEGWMYSKGKGNLNRRAGYQGRGYPSVGNYEVNFKYRTRLNELPKYTFEVPDLDLSTNQILSGISLLTQFFNR